MKCLYRMLALALCVVSLLCFTSCGEAGLVLPPHQHKYTYVVYPSSCSSYGYIEYDCACKHVYREQLTELADHAWQSHYTVDRQATYTTEGEKSVHCLNCDARKNITSIPKLEPDIPFNPID